MLYENDFRGYDKNEIQQIRFCNEQKSSWLRFFLLRWCVVLALVPSSGPSEQSAMAKADAGKNVGRSVRNFPLNSDGTVSVIIQFNQTPKAQHFADLAARGGRLKFSA